MGLSDDRRRTLIEAAASEAKRFGHPAAGPLHLVLAVGRRAPQAFATHFGRDAQSRLAEALRRQPPGGALQLEAFLINCPGEAPEDILAELAPIALPLLASDAAPVPSPAAPAPEDQVPALWSAGDVILATYDVLGVAGEGAMGRVYRVHHRQWDIDLAVKSPRPGYLETDAGKAAFEGEAQRWIDLGLHRHICTCHYVRRLGGIPRVFAEFADAGALADWIHDRRLYAGSPLEWMLDISVQFARGLAFAHERGVVHQDIKPANVLLTSAGEAKIADFGIARVAPAAVGDARVSIGGMTLPYRSPEQAKAAERSRAGRPAPTLTPATDVWSFAISLTEIFTGELLGPDGKDAGRALAGHVRRARSNLPGAVVDLLRRCLQKNPSRRPSMASVAAELEEIFERETGAGYPRDPGHDDALLAGEFSNRALSMLDLGRPDDAERHWASALEHDRNHPQATYNQGLHQWRRAEIADDELVRRLEAVQASHELDWVDEYLLALVHFERGDAASAAGLLDLARSAGEVTDARRELASASESAQLERTLEWEHGRVDSLAVTPDGRRVLAGSYRRTGTAELWDVETGGRLHTLVSLPDARTRSAANTPVALSADGMIAVAGCYDGTVRVWELAGGTCRRTLKAHTGNVVAIVLTPDGRLAITWPLSPQEPARVWDLFSGRPLRELADMGAVTSAALDDRAEHVLVGGPQGAHLWEPATGRRVRALGNEGDGVIAVALRGHMALTSRADGTAVLWDPADGRRLRTLVGHTGSVVAVALAADGRSALTGGLDSTARLWDLRSGRCIRTLEGAAAVTAVDFTPDGRLGVVGTIAGTMRAWRLDIDAIGHSPWAHARPRPTHEAVRSARRVRAALSETERLIADGDLREAGIRLQALRRLPGYERHPDVLSQWRVAVRAGRHTSAVGGWQSHTLPAGTPNQPLGIALAADGRRAVTAANATQLWDLEMGRPLRALESPRYWWRSGDWMTGVATAVALSRDGRLALIGWRLGAAQVWDPETESVRHILEGHERDITAVAITADARLGLTGGEDADARLWDLERGACVRTLHHPEQVDAVALTDDGRLALTGAADGMVRLWRLATGTCMALPDAHTSAVGCAALAGLRGLTGAGDGTVRVWDLERGGSVRSLDGHTGAVAAGALSLDGRIALTGSADRTAVVWDLESARPLRTLAHNAAVTDVALTPDARLALTACADGVARLWVLDWEYEFPEPADWDERARPLLSAFLAVGVPLPRPLTADGPLRHGAPTWADGDVERLARELEWAGLGWLRHEGIVSELRAMADRSALVPAEVPDLAAAPPRRKPERRPPNVVSDEQMEPFLERHAAALHAQVERMVEFGLSESVISIHDPDAPGISRERADAPWRRDPALAGRFHADHPNDIRVAFVLPSERRIELRWVRTDAVDRAIGGYAGILLPGGDRVSYRVTGGLNDPIHVSPEARANLEGWTSLCRSCGFDLLLEPVDEIVRRQFPDAPGIAFEAFTMTCPLCGEAMFVERRQGSSS